MPTCSLCNSFGKYMPIKLIRNDFNIRLFCSKKCKAIYKYCNYWIVINKKPVFLKKNKYNFENLKKKYKFKILKKKFRNNKKFLNPTTSLSLKSAIYKISKELV